METKRFNEEEVRKCYRFLNHKVCTEVRLIDPTKKKSPMSFFPMDENSFVEVCKTYNGEFNLYAGINERIVGGTEGKDVVSCKTIVIDIDAVRAVGFEKEPATDTELALSARIKDNIVDSIKKSGHILPTILNSGNGYQLWFAIPEIAITDLNRKEIENKLQLFQDSMRKRYSENDCIDKIGDLPRIIKIWGTLNIKSACGKETPERPFRVAKLEYGGEREENELLQKQILELEDEEIITEQYKIEQTTNLNMGFMPAPILYLLTNYKHEKPNGWMRIVEVFASFFRGIGLVKEEAVGKIIEWSRRQPYREQNEEHEIKDIVDRIYRNNIMCPNFSKLVFKESGYPYFGLKDKFEGVDLGNDWLRFKNPVVYYLAKQKESTTDIKQIVLELLARGKREDLRKATELISKEFQKDNFIYATKDDSKSELWIYSDGIYIPNGKSYIKEYCRKLLGEAFNTYVINEVTSKIEADNLIDSKIFFSHNYKYELPLLNGILNIQTRELKPFDSKKVFFTKLPVIYNPQATCPAIDNFLSQVLASIDDKKVFYEIAGFALVKEYVYEKAFMFIGNGRNGKGKSLELLKRLVGVENCSSLPLSLLFPDSFAISELFGKMLNLAGDIGNKDLQDTSMFKGLTGRDLITAKRKFLNGLSFQNYAKLVFACNELPTVYDMSRGFWDRWILLEFPYTFVTQAEYDQTKPDERKMLKIKDDYILDKIITPTELSGLLNKALDALDNLIKNKSFSTTAGTKEVKETWIRRANSFVAFALDNIDEDYDSYITKKEMRKRYTNYCKKHKINGKSDFAIKKTLQEVYGAMDERITTGSYNEGNQSQVFVWQGVKWKSKL